MLSIEIDEQIIKKIVDIFKDIKENKMYSKLYIETTEGKITTFEYTPKIKHKKQLLDINVTLKNNE